MALNSILHQLQRQLTASGVDLDTPDSICIQIEDAKGTVVTTRTGFADPAVYVEGASGRFYLMGYSSKDAKAEIALQNKAERRVKAVKQGVSFLP